MKKATALLLTIILLFSCGIISASADNSKLTEELELVIAHSAPADRIPISITIDGYDKIVQDMPSYPDNTQTGSNARFDKAYEEYAAYVDELEGTVLPEILDGVTEPKILSVGVGSYVRLEVEAQDVAKIAARDNVREIKYRDYKFYRNVPEGITDELQSILDSSAPDDIVPIYVFFCGRIVTVADMPSWSSMRPTEDERAMAIDEYSAFSEARNNYLKDRVLNGTQVEFLNCGYGDFWIIKAKAKDIPKIAGSGHVINVDYYDDSIIETNENEKIDPILADKMDQLNSSIASVRVYIELNIDHLTLRDMPSYPDVDQAETEYLYYQQQTLKPEYDKAIKELTSLVRFPKQYNCDLYRSVCYDSLVVDLTVQDIYELAEHSTWVKSIKLYESDGEWQTDHSRYDHGDTVTRYRERFLSQYEGADCRMYEELFHHEYCRDDKPYGSDWALVKASNTCIVCDVCHWEVVGGRLLYAGGYKQQPFTFDIGLYDAEQDRFFDINEIDFDDYPDLYEVWQRIDLGFCTSQRFLGDADGDREVTILDATKIQRGIAGLDNRNTIVATGADADGDGEMTVLDATRIQRYKAELCDLDGTEYNKA